MLRKQKRSKVEHKFLFLVLNTFFLFYRFDKEKLIGFLEEILIDLKETLK
jgi:hypothetical protein